MFSLGENVQKTMGKGINKTGYKMPFFGAMYHMQLIVEVVDVLRYFSMYPELCMAAKKYKLETLSTASAILVVAICRVWEEMLLISGSST